MFQSLYRICALKEKDAMVSPKEEIKKFLPPMQCQIQRVVTVSAEAANFSYGDKCDDREV